MSQMNFGAAIANNQRKINEGAKYLLLLLASGVGPLVLLFLDRPNYHHRNADPDGARQGVSTFFLAITWVMVGVLWLATPLLGFAAWLVALLSTSRRVAGFNSTPVTFSDFMKTMNLPSGWNWAWYAIAGVPLASAIYNTVMLPFAPTFVRSLGDNLSVAMLIAGAVIAVISGVRMTKIYSKYLEDQATLSTSVAAMLGATVRIFEDRHASFGFDGDRLIVRPHSTVDLAGVEARLAGTALGEQFSVTYKGYDAIILEPISQTDLDRIRTMRESGGLIQGERDLAAKPIDEPRLADADDDFDPFGAPAPVVADAPTEDGVITMSEEAWS